MSIERHYLLAQSKIDDARNFLDAAEAQVVNMRRASADLQDEHEALVIGVRLIATNARSGVWDSRVIADALHKLIGG